MYIPRRGGLMSALDFYLEGRGSSLVSAVVLFP